MSWSCWASVTPIPEGYSLVASPALTAGSESDWTFTDPAAWRIVNEGDLSYLEQHAQSSYKPPHRSPVNIAALRTPSVSSFVLEVEIMQTSREYNHRDACIFFNIVDPSNFYYTHIATKADPHAHQIMRVQNAPRLMITKEGSEGAAWGDKAWKTVRVVRDANSGSIDVWFEGVRIQHAIDTAHGAGWIGFGTFDDTARFRNIKLWAPDHATKAFPGFGSK